MDRQGGGFSQRFSGHKTGYFHALNKHLVLLVKQISGRKRHPDAMGR